MEVKTEATSFCQETTVILPTAAAAVSMHSTHLELPASGL
jgi:hypothetical protein